MRLPNASRPTRIRNAAPSRVFASGTAGPAKANEANSKRNTASDPAATKIALRVIVISRFTLTVDLPLTPRKYVEEAKCRGQATLRPQAEHQPLKVDEEICLAIRAPNWHSDQDCSSTIRYKCFISCVPSSGTLRGYASAGGS